MFEHNDKMNDEVMLNKLYNMIKTSLSLSNIDNRRELLMNFEKVSKDIDQKIQKSYLEEVQSKFYKTTNLDDERKRLSGLIVCINDRAEKRNKLLTEYLKVTGQSLSGLEDIEYLDELSNYKKRANAICLYLENEEEMLRIKKELTFLSNQLEKEREIKRNCEVVNAKLEEKLLNNFKNVIAGNKYYTSLSSKDIDNEISMAEREIKEKEEKVNAFVLAYESIKNKSITSREQLEEYSEYVTKIKEMYYECSKRLTFLLIYKLVMNPRIFTDEIYHKRNMIKQLLDDLTTKKIKLNIDEPNLLFDFYMLVKEQDVKIINSVDNMKKIRQIEEKIDYFNQKLMSLERKQEEEEIVSILKEYGIGVDEEINNEAQFTSEKVNSTNDISNFIESIKNDYLLDNNEKQEPINSNDSDIGNNNLFEPLNINPVINEPEYDIPKFEFETTVNKDNDKIVLKESNVFEEKSENLNNLNELNLDLEKEVVYLDNAIKEVRDLPVTMNMFLISKKASNVIKKVSDRLGIKNDVVNKIIVEKNSEDVQPVVKMPEFDYAEFWDEIGIKNSSSKVTDNDEMPDLPI